MRGIEMMCKRLYTVPADTLFVAWCCIHVSIKARAIAVLLSCMKKRKFEGPSVNLAGL